MQDPTMAEAKEDTELRPNNGVGENGNDELSQEIASRSPPETESTVSSLKQGAQGGNGESSECSPDTKSKKKKKRKKKKKKGETANVAPVLENDGKSTSTSIEEETDAKIDSHLSSKSINSAKECEENDPPVNNPVNKKKKKAENKVLEGELNTGDALEEKPGNQDISPSKEIDSAAGITEEEQGDLVMVKNEKQDIDVDSESRKEDGDAVSNGFGNENENVCEDSPKDTEPVTEEDENPPASEEEDGSCAPEALEAPVLEKVKPELATTLDGAEKSDVDTGHRDVPIEEVESDTEDNSSDELDNGGRNILCIFKIIYGVGLRALRKLFMEINPTWSNQPCDAAGFDKRKMKFTNKEEEASFNHGNIQEWDFSLMTTVLLYSRSCALEMSKRPGYSTALKKLKKYRNKLLGHPSAEMMSDPDFNSFWPSLSNHFITLGADANEINEIKLQSGETLSAGGHYKQLFLAEQAKLVPLGSKLDLIENKVDIITDIITNKSFDPANKAAVSPKDLSGPNWDEWMRFCDAVGDFDTRKNQYILVTDALSSSPENLDCFSTLRSVPWKMVLDFDPMSEEKGFYHSFTSQEGQGSLISMITPAEVKGSTIVSLARQIDPNKIQWMFVNGRSSDTAGKLQTFSDWEATSVKEISRFFGCCCDPDKFDKQKPVVCLILPFCQESVPYLEVTLSRLFENFDDQFNLKTVSFKQEKRLFVFSKVKMRTVDLCPDLLHLGLKELLSSSSSQRYRMPTSQAMVYENLSEKEYLYLKEHLEILYEGCEELPEVSNDPSEGELQLQNVFEEHRKLFISGNQISFVSLYDNHDAKRKIEKDIQIHVQRLLDQGLTRSMIVEIRHSPGTGGTTIARRVMWDIHQAYPCAFIEVSAHLYFDEDNSYVSKLADRIAALEEICHTSPVILIDGKQSGAIESLSNKLVRMLGKKGKRALLLRCLHGSKTSSRETLESSHVHHVFYVDVKLEDSIADLREFESKYKEFIERSLGETPASDPCRVFHFPLLAMMQEFRPRLEKIIDDTWSEMDGLQQEIALLVAFVQKYANQKTPALLLYDAFMSYIRLADGKSVTYKDIKQLFTPHLLNLMVPSNPLRRHGRMYLYDIKETSPDSYTLQHPLVAEMLLEKVFREQDCDLFRVVSQFLQFQIYQRECFLPLFEELFAYNKEGQKKRKFSLLFEELKAINSERAADVFCTVAEKTNDPVIFSNAARFLAKKEPPSFSKAKELIERAFQTNNSKLRYSRLCHTKGVILYIELQHMANTGKVRNLAKLEELASKVLKAYREARNFPPTYPNPLIGEVEVWLACIGWITKHICNRDSEETTEFLINHSPPFFRTCVSDSFCLLDVVDRIVHSVSSLPDPEDTQRRCNNARLSLMKTFRRPLSSTGRRRDGEDVVQACKALCVVKNFPQSSVLELKRLQAQFILSSSDPVDFLKQEHLDFLLKLLEELVLMEKQHSLAYHLMKVCVLVTGPRCYSLEQGLLVSEKWLEVSPHDCLPYFYQMAICFLKILDGNALEFTPKYLRALKMCREKSQSHCRNTQSTLFVGNKGKGMSRLVTRNTLFRGETDYSTDVPETVTRFWLTDSRRKLLECKGRIREPPSSDRGKTYPYIESVEGNLELYVGKNADIGKVDRDFTKGQLAYFVVSFNLQGPVANGITFKPQSPSLQ